LEVLLSPRFSSNLHESGRIAANPAAFCGRFHNFIFHFAFIQAFLSRTSRQMSAAGAEHPLSFSFRLPISPAVRSARAGLTNILVQGTLNLSILEGFADGRRLIFRPAVE